MPTWSKSIFLLVLVLLGVDLSLQAQDTCTLVVRGVLLAERSGKPIPFGHVQTADTAVVCDAHGRFVLQHCCPGPLPICGNALGFELARDTVMLPLPGGDLELRCPESVQQLGPSVVSVRGDHRSAEQSASLTRGANAMDLVASLEALPGVRSLASGNVAKPLVHGLYGARVPIVDGAIELGTQGWGLDHAPELDANRARQVRVIHGARSVWYAGSRGGSVVQLLPHRPDSSGNTKGHVQHAFSTNGRALQTSARITQGSPKFGWQLQASHHHGGDLRAPDYFLRNTGVRNGSGALGLRGRLGDRFAWDASANCYASNRGVLRGAHIGNLTDLEDALERGTPLFTEPDFSRELIAPRQEVQHWAAQTGVTYNNGQHTHLLRASVQHNDRQEFDVRRQALAGKPSLDLTLQTADIRLENHWGRLQTATQWRRSENRNQPGTQVLPLIPDYVENAFRTAAVWNPAVGFDNWTFGGQFEWANVVAFPLTSGFNPTFVRTHRERISARLATDYSYDYQAFHLEVSGILERRAPTVQEWYSQGLHQGVGGLEEGNPNLEAEHTAKLVLAPTLKLDRVHVVAVAYAQLSDGFIQLTPTGETSLTTRGAFPVFAYLQQDAFLAGTDAELHWFLKALGYARVTLGTSWAYAQALGAEPLTLTPAPETYMSLRGSTYKSFRQDRRTSINYPHWRWSTEVRRVGSQQRYPAEFDFSAPPAGYWVWNAGLTWRPVRSDGPTKWSFVLTGNNLLDASYRSYLNRMRYFADDPGRNVTLSVHFRF